MKISNMMKLKLTWTCLIIVISAQWAVSQTQLSEKVIEADMKSSSYLGKWNGFYRGHQLQGHHRSARGQGGMCGVIGLDALADRAAVLNRAQLQDAVAVPTHLNRPVTLPLE